MEGCHVNMKTEGLKLHSWISTLTVENCEEVAEEISRRIGKHLFTYVADRPGYGALFVQTDCHLNRSLAADGKFFTVTTWEYNSGQVNVGFSFSYNHGFFYHSTRAREGEFASYEGQPTVEFDGDIIRITEPRERTNLRVVIAIQEGVYVDE